LPDLLALTIAINADPTRWQGHGAEAGTSQRSSGQYLPGDTDHAPAGAGTGFFSGRFRGRIVLPGKTALSSITAMVMVTRNYR
jgi:hypothetical protein